MDNQDTGNINDDWDTQREITDWDKGNINDNWDTETQLQQGAQGGYINDNGDTGNV